MYRIKSQMIDLFVTEEHQMYVKAKTRKKAEFGLVPAKDIFRKHVAYKKDADWAGKPVSRIKIPEMQIKGGQGGRGFTHLPDIRMSVRAYMVLLGSYISDGSIIDDPRSGSYGIDICAPLTNPRKRDAIVAALLQENIRFGYADDKLRIY